MHIAKADNNRCISLKNDIKRAHFYYFGIDFPFWYSIAQAEAESQCRHNILSKDGIGSQGFAQITFSVWKNQLFKEGIKEINTISNHSRAQAYINFVNHKQSYCKKLFETYQMYNGGSLVSIELKRARSCQWQDGYRVCRRKNVCVLKKGQTCIQYRNACDINYSYSKKVYQLAQKYKIGIDKYIYW